LSGSTIKMNIKTLDETEEKLVIEVCKPHISSTRDKIFLRPLKRIGTRPTKMFIVNFRRGKTKTRVFVLKIVKEKYIKCEYNRWCKFLKDRIRGSKLEEPKFEGDLGAILYEHAGAFTEEEIEESKEFNEVIFSKRVKLETKIKILDDLYDYEMKLLNEGAYKGRCNSILKEYQYHNHNYLHSPDSTNFMESWFGLKKDNEYIEFFGHKTINPSMFLKNFRGFKQKTKIMKRNLHGDLHPRNIILNKNSEPRLIDFEWAHKGHILKDYVILEGSIKFFQMYKYRNLPLNRFMEFEKQLINFEKFENIEHLFPKKEDKIFLDAYRMISHIRNKAMNFCIWKNKQLEYLCSLFLVSYGLYSISGCNSLYCLGSLGLIAEKLQGSDLKELNP